MTTMADDMLNLEPTSLEALSRQSGEPDWALAARRAAQEAFETLPFPERSEEAWRRTPPDLFDPHGRRIIRIRPAFDLLGEGVPEELISPFEEVLASREGVPESLAAGGALLQQKYSALNAAFRSGGAWVEIPRGRYLEQPVRITHQVPDLQVPAAFFPHSRIVGERHGKATVVESFASQDGDLLAAPVVEIQLEEGANLQYVLVSHWGQATRSLTRLDVRLARDSQLRVLFLGLGGATTKAFLTGNLEGEGAKSEILGLVFASGQQHFDVDTLQNHHVPFGNSEVLFNCALNEASRSVFTGNIFVAPGARKTDAYQKNRNLLLSGKAHADSIPKLEILADDVRCTHGATFTTYDRDQQFYLQSRGLPDADARRLIITGFFQEVIERLEGQALVDWLAGLMQQKMEDALGS
ncbi:MAG: Fe-S cluster assembly protein SufD [Candidatus Xenobium sp.]|jgi:Fe-S cluster assembly protein SufD